MAASTTTAPEATEVTQGSSGSGAITGDTSKAKPKSTAKAKANGNGWTVET